MNRTNGLAVFVFALALNAAAQVDDAKRTKLEREVVGDYAGIAHDLYARAESVARKHLAAIEAFVKAPTAEGLASARNAWIAARKVYGLTEALRFYGGPIDHPRTGPETFLNAWPLDEAYIDGVEGRPDAGIINDPERFPQISAGLLMAVNERGGEANVCLGWHAVEFLLWGQDKSLETCGQRPHTDFVDGKAKNADRRREFLVTVARQIVEHLAALRKTWAEPGDYRREFLGTPTPEATRRILTGLVVLSGFEMAGERLAVAFETRDQEQEHSCFSDTTHNDFEANQLGIMTVWRSKAKDGRETGLAKLAHALSKENAEDLDRLLEKSLAAIRAIPKPFDRAIQAPDGSPARTAVEGAIIALEQQAEALAALALELGHDIALRPGGG